ncbi:type II toxin-antitoxin system RelB family antitoxin [Enterococcus nangangensis]|uniref:type II toxin-antitoxin system RelB family antitoxin n=1 Tax=Enterococcus nangangensis TaxID=2559926 RepID=UPI0010F84D7F|nr:DUF6290 family protein [Enterococcus nangangensis]
MAIITVRVSDEEKEFLDSMAKFEGKSLSELMKTATLESLEDAYDARVGDLAYEKYLENPQSISLKEFAKELGLS